MTDETNIFYPIGQHTLANLCAITGIETSLSQIMRWPVIKDDSLAKPILQEAKVALLDIESHYALPY
jgi:hypothetical protein